METLRSLREKVLRQLDEAGETVAIAIVDDAINQAHAERLTSTNWPFLIYPELQTFTLEADRKTYTLHPDFHRPYYFWNRTKGKFLAEIPMRGLEEAAGDNWDDASGTATGSMFGLWSRTPVARQPTSASQLTITSTSTSDTGASYAVIITGTNANGVATETLNPLGTSPAVSIHSFTQILSITLTAPWTGTFLMTANSAAVTVLSMLPRELGRSYQQLTLLHTPAAGDVIEYRFYRTPKDLSNDYDLPLIPFPYSKILVWDALLIFAAYDNQLTNIRASEWRTRVQSIEQSMQAAFMEAQSITARPRLVRFIES